MKVVLPSSFAQTHRRWHTNYIKASIGKNVARIPLENNKALIGVYSERGQRSYQEDKTSLHTLNILPSELQLTLRPPTGASTTSRSISTRSTSQTSLDDALSARGWEPPLGQTHQVSWFGIFDGHGGPQVSTFLQSQLATIFESVEAKEVNQVISYLRGLGGYFRRFEGGEYLKDRCNLIPYPTSPKSPGAPAGSGRLWKDDLMIDETKDVKTDELMTLPERISLAFLKADQMILRDIKESQSCGSTASVMLLHSLDFGGKGWWESKRVSMTIGHCGDSRILLCRASDGMVIPLTEKHHAESRLESSRLRRLGQGASGVVMDSFGESRWMGAVENTRSLGDGVWKQSGVSAEPEVCQKVLRGDDWGFAVLVTDGITSRMSDQEVADLARTASTPYLAARSVVSFASDLGSEDNCTCMVVPFAAWGKVKGEDSTKERREYRRKTSGEMSGRQRRM